MPKTITLPDSYEDITMITAAELSELIGMSIQGIYLQLQKGRLKGRKIGNYWYFTDEDIKSYLTAHTQPVTYDKKEKKKKKK